MWGKEHSAFIKQQLHFEHCNMCLHIVFFVCLFAFLLFGNQNVSSRQILFTDLYEAAECKG